MFTGWYNTGFGVLVGLFALGTLWANDAGWDCDLMSWVRFGISALYWLVDFPNFGFFACVVLCACIGVIVLACICSLFGSWGSETLGEFGSFGFRVWFGF